jgi:hypothetical protein
MSLLEYTGIAQLPRLVASGGDSISQVGIQGRYDDCDGQLKSVWLL